MKYRKLIFYKSHFEDFMDQQRPRIRHKIVETLKIIESIQRVPDVYLKKIEGSKGLYEIRIQFASDIFRVFCFFDSGRLVVLLSGFQKKTQKTPKREISKAEKLMKEYYNEKAMEEKS